MKRPCSRLAAFALAAIPALFASVGAQTTTRIPSLGGAQPDGFSGRPYISANGRYVAFESNATNLVANDTNGVTDIFVRDLQTGTTRRVSVASDGTQSDSFSFFPALSADGRYVAFESNATNLVANDTNKTFDIFVHDTTTGETRRVSVATGGAEGDGSSNHAVLSADGRYVAFESLATNLVTGDTNQFGDVFRHDLQTGDTVRVSVSASGEQGRFGASYRPSISADGRYVAFSSFSPNLVPDDTNNKTDIFRRDMQDGTLIRVSVPNGGGQANESSSNLDMSDDGRFVIFFSTASNLVAGDANSAGDVFVADVQAGSLARIAAAGDETKWIYGVLAPTISGDGHYVAFVSDSADILPGKTNGSLQAFRYDIQSGVISLLSATPADAPGNGASYSPTLNFDGSIAVFTSEASDLVANDTNGAGDIFVRSLTPVTGPTLDDVRDALKIAGGVATATPADLTRFSVPSGGKVDLLTAVRTARQAAGL